MDGKDFIVKIRETLLNDNELQSIVPNGIRVVLSLFSPNGNQYPQISLSLNEGESELVFPVGHYKFYVGVYIKKNKKEPYKISRLIIDRINKLINRKANDLSEIDVTNNIGLRVSKCLKSEGQTAFNEDTGLYETNLVYDVIQSEVEDFTLNNTGWN
jgi:hypothetical protein